jgi:hypothetical protein
VQGGRAVVGLLWAASVSAVGIVLTLNDVVDKFLGPYRPVYLTASLCMFILTVGSALYAQWRQIGALKDQLVPKVKIVFEDRGQRPYLQCTQLACSNDVIAEERHYRIGVRNLGKTEIPRVRAVLERCEPVGSDGFKRIATDHVYPGQPLHAMGKPNDTDEFLLGVSGEEPSVYVDVVHDHISSDGSTKMICFAYAATSVPHPSPSGTYRITIRVEGGGAYDLASFVVERVGKDKVLTMRPAEMDGTA